MESVGMMDPGCYKSKRGVLDLDNRTILEDIDSIYNGGIDWSKFENATVLITGAYGMLPVYMARALLYLNEIVPPMKTKIVALVRDKEKAESIFHKYLNKKHFEIFVHDLKSEVVLPQKIDYIIHAASLASPQYFGTNPVDTCLPNTIGTYHLLNLAIQKEVRGFLFFSSGSIYGSTLFHKKIKESDFGCVDTLDLRSCYAESKRMGETLCKSYQHQYGVPTKIARIFHTYGPSMDIANDKRAFSEFVSNVVNGENIVIKSDGMAQRAFCYITDTIIALLKLLLDGVSGEAYNIANNRCVISMKDLANTLVALFPEKGLQVVFGKRKCADAYIDTEREEEYGEIDITKMIKLCGEPSVDLETGFKRTILSFENCPSEGAKGKEQDKSQ